MVAANAAAIRSWWPPSEDAAAVPVPDVGEDAPHHGGAAADDDGRHDPHEQQQGSRPKLVHRRRPPQINPGGLLPGQGVGYPGQQALLLATASPPPARHAPTAMVGGRDRPRLRRRAREPCTRARTGRLPAGRAATWPPPASRALRYSLRSVPRVPSGWPAAPLDPAVVQAARSHRSPGAGEEQRPTSRHTQPPERRTPCGDAAA